MGFTWNAETQRLEDEPSVCWRLSAGRWTQRPIEGGQLELSELRLAPGAQLPCALGGADDPHWPTTRLLVDEIANRVAPHAVWYCAPAFFGCEAIEQPWAGYAFFDGGVVMLRTSSVERWTVLTAYHEAWHVLESLLTPAERVAVDQAVARGGEWQGEYYDRASERRARAFEAYAMHRHEAPPTARTGAVGRVLDALHRWTMPAHERVFLDAFEGKVGRRAAARRWVSSARLSAAALAQAEADRESAAQAWVQQASWSALAASAALVVGATAWRWLA